ncbi:MAG: histidine triad nucleotide-binding protein [Patescibacteria group bacterium]|nr:histidine triad nucleotide-binding protein [Patescibacteria group bacterium]MDD5121636.1 histidine triad nucleotide-binding protein [Patescibacteria group bacterium]MDD5221910.1 histidine triad nucleotide-binding protein [Patescibacteria group bacterium]MDD5396200.1 histidine triad nucleotide-binding protein [Patescibacteria group bacterium]
MCIFCQIINKEIPKDFIFADDQLVAFNDLHPSAPIHILIVSKKHIDSIATLKEEDINLIGNMIWRAKVLAEEKGIAKSGYKLIFNCGEDGGQIIQHIHLHLLGGEKVKCIV